MKVKESLSVYQTPSHVIPAKTSAKMKLQYLSMPHLLYPFVRSIWLICWAGVWSKIKKIEAVSFPATRTRSCERERSVLGLHSRQDVS